MTTREPKGLKVLHGKEFIGIRELADATGLAPATLRWYCYTKRSDGTLLIPQPEPLGDRRVLWRTNRLDLIHWIERKLERGRYNPDDGTQ